jgi:hypothetical protein
MMWPSTHELRSAELATIGWCRPPAPSSMNALPLLEKFNPQYCDNLRNVQTARTQSDAYCYRVDVS